MNRSIYQFSFTLGIFAFTCCSSLVFCETMHKLLAKQHPSLIKQYTLVDLGEVDLQPQELTKSKDGSSLGPLINNNGKIACNNSNGCFIYRKTMERYTPTFAKSKLYAHAINNKDDIVASLHTDEKTIYWQIWPTALDWNGGRKVIDTVEQEGNKVDLFTISDLGFIAGQTRPYNQTMPIVWNQEQGLYRVGYDQYINLHGIVKGINSNNDIAGKSEGHHENFPFLWSGSAITNLFEFRKQFRCPTDGKLHFEDVLIDKDSSLYGTYWINKDFFENKEPTHKEYLAFSWSPQERKIKLSDLNGMRFSAINADRRIVGSVNGKAAILDPEEKPVELIYTVPVEEIDNWELLEATDINDSKQIVGYGKRDGKIHLFLANPL